MTTPTTPNQTPASAAAPAPPSTAPTFTAQVTLIYGPTGSRKTTQVGSFAEYIAETTNGLPIRVISAESAGAEPLLPYIEAGLIEVLWLSRDMNPRAAIRKLGRGEWPQFKDGIPVRGANNSLVWVPADKNGLTAIGGYAIEGLTSIADLVSQELKSFAASGAQVTGAKEGTGMAGAGYTSDGETFGQGSQGQVGAVQDMIMEMLRELPKNVYAKSGGKCVHVLFTAHEAKGQDEISGQNVYGPGTIGKAITMKLFKEVGTALHLETETTDKMANGKKVGTEAKVWAYYEPHLDSDSPAAANIKWYCKPRIPATPEAHAELQRIFPGGRFELTFDQTLGTYLRFQDRVHGEAMKKLAKLRELAMASRAAAPVAPVPTSASPAGQPPTVSAKIPAPPAPASVAAPAAPATGVKP